MLDPQEPLEDRGSRRTDPQPELIVEWQGVTPVRAQTANRQRSFSRAILSMRVASAFASSVTQPLFLRSRVLRGPFLPLHPRREEMTPGKGCDASLRGSRRRSQYVW